MTPSEGTRVQKRANSTALVERVRYSVRHPTGPECRRACRIDCYRWSEHLNAKRLFSNLNGYLGAAVKRELSSPRFWERAERISDHQRWRDISLRTRFSLPRAGRAVRAIAAAM